jgi:hypothetical protein
MWAEIISVVVGVAVFIGVFVYYRLKFPDEKALYSAVIAFYVGFLFGAAIYLLVGSTWFGKFLNLVGLL